jgi:mannose-6-phosphate isomerase-like protein (cupin superfamily)
MEEGKRQMVNGRRRDSVFLNQVIGRRTMSILIERPQIIEAAGTKKKIIEEYFGNVTSKTAETSIARMISPGGWEEPAQRPDFHEYTVVLKGMLRVKTKEKIYDVKAGQGILIAKSEWVQYSSPNEGGAEYIAVCLPAFSPDTVHRQE